MSKHRDCRGRHHYRPPWNPYALAIALTSGFAIMLSVAIFVALAVP